MTSSQTDRIEKQIVLRAPRSRVWRALTDAAEFGRWFGVALAGEFAPGARLVGKITHPGYEHLTFEIVLEQLDPERRVAWRWHPYAIDPKVDYSTEPTTRVEFVLDDAPGGTRLTLVESGFDALPPARRATAFRMNAEGWSAQMGNIERHVSGPSA